MARKSNKISTRWIRQARDDFREFLDETDFQDPDRLVERGPKFLYPECMLTYCRPNMDKTTPRIMMIAFVATEKHQKIYRERPYKVEPMQGLAKDIFELDRCWMRRDENSRWLFASMKLAVQMNQLQAFKQGKSTWNVKGLVMGKTPRPQNHIIPSPCRFFSCFLSSRFIHR